MTENEFIPFEEMLTPEMLEELGISKDRDFNQCLVRLLAGYRRLVEKFPST